MSIGTGKTPHQKMRKTCKHCPQVNHDNTPQGNTHRFHGPDSFCRTHHDTGRAKKYCTPQGNPKSTWGYGRNYGKSKKR